MSKAQKAIAATFVDRWGGSHTPPDLDAVIGREGAFAVFLSGNEILLSWPQNAPSVAELPGGGIEEGEDHAAGLLREIEEETGLAIERDPGRALLRQTVDFYAENKKQFWHYDQAYYLLEGSDIDALRFKGSKATPEGGRMQWVAIGDLPDTKIHHVHKAALQEVLACRRKV